MAALKTVEEYPRASPIRRPGENARSHVAKRPVIEPREWPDCPSNLPLAVHMDEDLSKQSFFLLSFLSSATRSTGSARVKIASLCAVTRNDDRTTRKQVQKLVSLGYLTVDRKDSTTYVYRLTEKALTRAPKRPERRKYTLGDCVCGTKGVKISRDGVCFGCIRKEGRKRAYVEVQRLHPDWSKDQILAELMLETKRQSYKKPLRELEREQDKERRLAERFAVPDDEVA